MCSRQKHKRFCGPSQDVFMGVPGTQEPLGKSHFCSLFLWSKVCTLQVPEASDTLFAQELLSGMWQDSWVQSISCVKHQTSSSSAVGHWSEGNARCAILKSLGGTKRRICSQCVTKCVTKPTAVNPPWPIPARLQQLRCNQHQLLNCFQGRCVKGNGCCLLAARIQYQIVPWRLYYLWPSPSTECILFCGYRIWSSLQQ